MYSLRLSTPIAATAAPSARLRATARLAAARASATPASTKQIPALNLTAGEAGFALGTMITPMAQPRTISAPTSATKTPRPQATRCKLTGQRPFAYPAAGGGQGAGVSAVAERGAAPAGPSRSDL